MSRWILALAASIVAAGIHAHAHADAVVEVPPGYERAPTVKSGDPVIEFEVFYDQAALDELGIEALTALVETYAPAINELILESGGAFFLDKEVRLLKLTALPPDVVLPEDTHLALPASREAAMPLRDPRTDLVFTIAGAAVGAAVAFQFGFPTTTYALVHETSLPKTIAHEWGHMVDGTHVEAVCWEAFDVTHITRMAGGGTPCLPPPPEGWVPVNQFSYPNRLRVEEAWYTVSGYGQSTRCIDAVCLNQVSRLVLPGFAVDVEDEGGPTTFVAIRNTSDEAVTATISYHGKEALQVPIFVESAELAPQNTLTWDVRSKIPDLGGLPVVNGTVQGLIVITEGVGPDAPHLVGDYFLLDAANDFATGGRFGTARPTEFCDLEEIRFVEFGSGVRLRIILDEPASFTYSAYKENGEVLVESALYTTSSHLTVLELDELVTGANFGTLVFDFSASGGGSVIAKYEAFGRFSVSMPGACMD